MNNKKEFCNIKLFRINLNIGECNNIIQYYKNIIKNK